MPSRLRTGLGRIVRFKDEWVTHKSNGDTKEYIDGNILVVGYLAKLIMYSS